MREQVAEYEASGGTRANTLRDTPHPRSGVFSVRHGESLIARFIRSFLGFLLVPKGPQPCRLMFREILSDSARDEELSEALVSTSVGALNTLLGNLLLGGGA